jgi:hypothetical protein
MTVVLITLAATAAALLLAAFFTLRRRLGLAVVCMLCLLALFRPGVVLSGVSLTDQTESQNAD